jgi:hypothetical protein
MICVLRCCPAGPGLCSFALEGVRIRVHFAGPPAKTAAGNLNRLRESRAMGQLVGGGSA